jgi:AcrR family transcriptional regulator
MRVFAKRGYHGSSVSDITKEAGVSKALFYHYFASKRDLLVIFARRRLEDYLPLAMGMEEIRDPKQRLLFLVDFVLHELTQETEKLRFINMLYLTEDGIAAIREAMKKFEDQFAKIFQIERQLFLELGFSDPDLEATYMRSVLQGISLEYMLGPAEYPLEEMRKKILNRYISLKEV